MLLAWFGLSGDFWTSAGNEAECCLQSDGFLSTIYNFQMAVRQIPIANQRINNLGETPTGTSQLGLKNHLQLPD